MHSLHHALHPNPRAPLPFPLPGAHDHSRLVSTVAQTVSPTTHAASHLPSRLPSQGRSTVAPHVRTIAAPCLRLCGFDFPRPVGFFYTRSWPATTLLISFFFAAVLSCSC